MELIAALVATLAAGMFAGAAVFVSEIVACTASRGRLAPSFALRPFFCR